jgi:hypothetical protein
VVIGDQLTHGLGLLLMSAVVGGAVTGCARRPSSEASRVTTPTQVEESSRYGDDRVIGLLHVTTSEAYFEYNGRRIVLVAASPMTAVSPQALMTRTPGDLQHLSNKRVRAQGDLQGDILWGAQVTPLE